MPKEYLAYTDKYVSTFKPPEEILEKVREKIRLCPTSRTPYVDVPFVNADSVTTEGYGRFVDSENEKDCQVRLLSWPQRSDRKRNPVVGGFGAGIVDGKFLCRWIDDEVQVVNRAVGKPSYAKAWRDSGGNVYTQGGDFHPDGEQIFLPIDNRPFIMVLCKFSRDSAVSPLNFVAFRFDGRRGFAVNPGVYHQAVFPLEDEVHLRSVQGKVHGVVMMDSFREFGAYLRIENPFGRSALDGRRAFAAMPSKKLKLQLANESNLNPFGQLLSGFDSSLVTVEKWPNVNGARPVWMGDEGGVSAEEFTYAWNDDGSGYMFNTDGKLSGVTSEDGKIYVNRMVNRPDGGHVIYPVQSVNRFLMVLALENPDKNSQSLNTDTFAAFEFPPNVGLLINSNVWHSLPLPVDSAEIKCNEAFSATNANSEQDILADLGCLIEIQRN